MNGFQSMSHDPYINAALVRVDALPRYGGAHFLAKRGRQVHVGAFDNHTIRHAYIKVLVDGSLADRHAMALEHDLLMRLAATGSFPQPLDSGGGDGFYYSATVKVEGTSVACRLQTEEQLLRFEAATIVLGACHALQHLRPFGAVHGDLTPDRILQTRDGRIVITGLRHAIMPWHASVSSPSQLPGTYAYWAPERFSSPPQHDERIEVYALAACLWESSFGEPPYGRDDGDFAALYRRKLQPVRFPAGCPVPQAYADLLQKNLSPCAADRHATVREFAQALSPFALAGFEAEHTTPATPRHDSPAVESTPPSTTQGQPADARPTADPVPPMAAPSRDANMTKPRRWHPIRPNPWMAVPGALVLGSGIVAATTTAWAQVALLLGVGVALAVVSKE